MATATATMWTYTVNGPNSIAEREVPAPQPEDLVEGQVLLRVIIGGICGSDLPYFKGREVPYGVRPASGGPAEPPPGAPLHEVVGEVIATRDDGLPTGSVVVGWATAMNAMCEYIVVNGKDVIPYTSELSPSQAIMLQPLACVFYAVDCLSGIEGANVAVIGQGPIGILFSHVLKSRGAKRVTGIDRVDRSSLADTFLVDETILGASDHWAARLTNPADRPNIVVEAVGHQVSTLTDAVSALADGGQIYYFGIPDDPIYPFPMMLFLRKLGRLISGYTPLEARRGALKQAEAHVLAHPEIVEPYLSHTYKFSEAQDAFLRAINPAPGQMKVTLEL